MEKTRTSDRRHLARAKLKPRIKPTEAAKSEQYKERAKYLEGMKDIDKQIAGLKTKLGEPQLLPALTQRSNAAKPQKGFISRFTTGIGSMMRKKKSGSSTPEASTVLPADYQVPSALSEELIAPLPPVPPPSPPPS